MLNQYFRCPAGRKDAKNFVVVEPAVITITKKGRGQGKDGTKLKGHRNYGLKKTIYKKKKIVELC